GAALGADPATFMGMAGLGDLVLTCTDNQSRNRRFGMMLGQGMDVQSAQEHLDQVVKETEKEEAMLIKKRDEVEEDISDRYLRSYKRLRNGLSNGLAVVPMEKGAALGMALPPQTQVEVRHKNRIIIDENSGRIVVHPSFFETAEK